MENFYAGPEGKGPGGKYLTFDAINHVREARTLPDGTPNGAPIPGRLKPVLLALSTYYPNIFPSNDELARATGLARSTVIAHLAELEDRHDLIRTKKVGLKRYRLIQFDRLIRGKAERTTEQRLGKRKAAQLGAAA